MEDYYRDADYTTSKSIPLSFINNPPSDLDTIFTVLARSGEENLRNNSDHIRFVAFDQPLYQKARYILSFTDLQNDKFGLSKVMVVRLGGFHMLVSFLGSIGFIMDGSGLKEAFHAIFAEKILSGHVYSRAVRGHSLVQTVLGRLIFESIELSEQEKA